MLLLSCPPGRLRHQHLTSVPPPRLPTTATLVAASEESPPSAAATTLTGAHPAPPTPHHTLRRPNALLMQRPHPHLLTHRRTRASHYPAFGGWGRPGWWWWWGWWWGWWLWWCGGGAARRLSESRMAVRNASWCMRKADTWPPLTMRSSLPAQY